jgi:acetolactate synthase I/II/III large subunit
MAKLTCGALLAQLLEAYGVRHAFGIPGVHNVELYRGLGATGIVHIGPRHEQGAGFMADGYARSSGRPGVAFVITGPGVTNIATAIGQAYADSVPMLIIAAVNQRHQLGFGRGYLHEMPNQRNLTAGLTAFAHTLLRADELPDVLAAAFAVFTSSRPRPVCIEVPIDVMSEEVDGDQAKLPRDVRHINAPGPAPAATDAALDVLAASRRTLLIAGGGAQGAAREIHLLAERLGAAVQLTTNARGLLPIDHALLGDFGLSKAEGRSIMNEADAVLAVGTEFGETDFDFYADTRFKVGPRLVRIDIDPRQLAIGPKADVAIVSDARTAARSLLERLQQRTPSGAGGPDIDWAKDAAIRLSKVAHGLREPEDTFYDRLATVLRGVPSDPILVGDSTKPAYRAGLTYRSPKPRSFFCAGTGFGTLGYALPAAIGAKVANPDRPVIALLGDGGLQFTLPELISAREAGAGIIVVVWNNNGYREIRDHMVKRDIQPLGVDPIPPDFMKTADAMGILGARVGDLEELGQVLRQRTPGDRVPIMIELDASRMG